MAEQQPQPSIASQMRQAYAQSAGPTAPTSSTYTQYSMANPELIRDPYTDKNQDTLKGQYDLLETYAERLAILRGKQLTAGSSEFKARLGAQTDLIQAKMGLASALTESAGKSARAAAQQAGENWRQIIQSYDTINKQASGDTERFLNEAHKAYGAGVLDDTSAAWRAVAGSLTRDGALDDKGIPNPYIVKVMTDAVAAFKGVDWAPGKPPDFSGVNLQNSTKQSLLRAFKRANAVDTNMKSMQKTITDLGGFDVEGKTDEEIRSDLEKLKTLTETIDDIYGTEADLGKIESEIRRLDADDSLYNEFRDDYRVIRDRLLGGTPSDDGQLQQPKDPLREAYIEKFYRGPDGELSPFLLWAKERGYNLNRLGESDGKRYFRGPLDMIALNEFNLENRRGLTGYTRPAFAGNEFVEVTKSISSFDQADGLPVQAKIDGKWVDVTEEELAELRKGKAPLVLPGEVGGPGVDRELTRDDFERMFGDKGPELRLVARGRKGLTNASMVARGRRYKDAVVVRAGGKRRVILKPDDVRTLSDEEFARLAGPEAVEADAAAEAAEPPQPVEEDVAVEEEVTVEEAPAEAPAEAPDPEKVKWTNQIRNLLSNHDDMVARLNEAVMAGDVAGALRVLQEPDPDTGFTFKGVSDAIRAHAKERDAGKPFDGRLFVEFITGAEEVEEDRPGESGPTMLAMDEEVDAVGMEKIETPEPYAGENIGAFVEDIDGLATPSRGGEIPTTPQDGAITDSTIVVEAPEGLDRNDREAVLAFKQSVAEKRMAASPGTRFDASSVLFTDESSIPDWVQRLRDKRQAEGESGVQALPMRTDAPPPAPQSAAIIRAPVPQGLDLTDEAAVRAYKTSVADERTKQATPGVTFGPGNVRLEGEEEVLTPAMGRMGRMEGAEGARPATDTEVLRGYLGWDAGRMGHDEAFVAALDAQRPGAMAEAHIHGLGRHLTPADQGVASTPDVYTAEMAELGAPSRPDVYTAEMAELGAPPSIPQRTPEQPADPEMAAWNRKIARAVAAGRRRGERGGDRGTAIRSLFGGRESEGVRPRLAGRAAEAELHRAFQQRLPETAPGTVLVRGSDGEPRAVQQRFGGELVRTKPQGREISGAVKPGVPTERESWVTEGVPKERGKSPKQLKEEAKKKSPRLPSEMDTRDKDDAAEFEEFEAFLKTLKEQ